MGCHRAGDRLQDTRDYARWNSLHRCHSDFPDPRVRVVVDQRGIKRIEHLTTSARVDAISEPVADMVELDDLD